MSADKQKLPERVAALEQTVKSIRQPRDGRDGRDGEPGPPGIGEPGPRGRDGKDVEPAVVAGLVSEEVAKAVAAIPKPNDGLPGRDGADADPQFVRQLVERAVADMPRPRDGKDADPDEIRRQVIKAVGAIKVKDGVRGPRGPEGPIGPMPMHEWDGTRLRFEIDVGEWGEWVDLRGPQGYGGGGGSFAAPTPPFDLDSLGMADPLITPEEVIVKQNGIWLRMGWDAFVALVGAPPPTGQRYADDYADHYTVYE